MTEAKEKLLPDSLEEAFSPRIRYLMNCAARASQELVCDVVGCWCGAQPGEYCRRKNGEPGTGCSTHADRRVSASRWRKSHQKEWKKLRDQTFRRLVKQVR